MLVPGVDQAVQVGAGNGHSCVRRADGSVWCWGANDRGQLGDPSARHWRMVPAPVPGLSDAVQLAVGAFHNCALRSNRTVWCWGWNDYRQLGDGGRHSRAEPRPVSGLQGVEQVVAGGFHTCARLGDGTARCWGWNSDGQLGVAGTGIAEYRARPVPVQGLRGAVQLAAGSKHNCSVLAHGSVACWGAGWQLGSGGKQNRARATAVVGLTDVTQVATGGGHSCAVTRAGHLWCWGLNGAGQLGDGARSFRLEPVQVRGPGEPVALVALGTYHSCALDRGGALWCWGEGGSGQLGQGSCASYPGGQLRQPLPMRIQ